MVRGGKTIGSVTGKGVEYIKANLEQPVLDLPDAVKIIGNSFNIMQKNEEILEQSVIVPQSGPDHDFHAVGMVQSPRSSNVVNNPSHEESSSSDNPVPGFIAKHMRMHNTEGLPPSTTKQLVLISHEDEYKEPLR